MQSLLLSIEFNLTDGITQATGHPNNVQVARTSERLVSSSYSLGAEQAGAHTAWQSDRSATIESVQASRGEKSAPKGLCSKAQGCREAATLGSGFLRRFNPN